MNINFNNLIRIAIITLLSLTSLKAQWTIYEEYKEIQASDRPITQIIANPADTFFIVVDDSNNIRKFDYAGNLISKKHNFTPITYLSYHRMKVNNDGKTYMTGRFHIPDQNVKLSVKIYDLNTDSLILDKSFPLSSFNGGEGAGLSYLYDDYNYELKKFVYAFSFYRSYSSKFADDGYSYYYGTLSIYNSILDSSISYASFGVNWMNSTSDFNYFTTVSNATSYSFRPSSGVKDGSSDDLFSLISLKNGKKIILSRNLEYYSSIKTNIRFGIFPNFCRFSNNDSTFVSIKDSLVNVFKYNADTAYLSNSFITETPVKEAIFSPDDKYIITSHSKCEIHIYYLAQKVIARTYMFNYLPQSNVLTCLKNRHGFLSGYSSGAIKFFQPDIFSDSLKARFTSDKKIIQTNKPIRFFSTSPGLPDSSILFSLKLIVSGFELPS